MPLPHTCASCGQDLTRLPAPLDPHYRLPIVVCPACSTAVVRRSDGRRVIPRTVRRHIHATRKLAEGLILLLIFSAGFVGLCFALQSSLERYRVPFFAAMTGLISGDEETSAYQWRNNVGIVILIFWIIMCLGTGAYLTSVARHRSRLRVLALWLVPVLLTLILPATISICLDIADRKQNGMSRLPTIQSEFRWWIGHLYQVFIGALVVILLGIPAGRSLRRSLDAFSARRFRRLRKRLIVRRQRA